MSQMFYSIHKFSDFLSNIIVLCIVRTWSKEKEMLKCLLHQLASQMIFKYPYQDSLKNKCVWSSEHCKTLKAVLCRTAWLPCNTKSFRSWSTCPGFHHSFWERDPGWSVAMAMQFAGLMEGWAWVRKFSFTPFCCSSTCNLSQEGEMWTRREEMGAIKLTFFLNSSVWRTHTKPLCVKYPLELVS